MRYLPPDLVGLPQKTSEWTDGHVKTWLWHGFSRSHLKSDDIPGFYPLHDQFSARESPEAEIARLCSKSVRFRAKVVPAIRGLLGDLPPNGIGFRVFHHMQNLTIQLHEPSLLEPMWARLASPGFLDRAHSEEKQELFARAFLSAEKLSSSGDVQTLLSSRMLASRHFNPDWTPSVLASMLQQNPANLVSSLRLLSKFVDSITDEARIASIVSGCRAVIDELVEKFADHSRVVEAMNAEEIFEMASKPGTNRITNRVALIVVNELKIDFTYEDQITYGDPEGFEIVIIDRSSLLSEVKNGWWTTAATKAKRVIKAVVPRDYITAKLMNRRREFQQHHQVGQQMRWQDERVDQDA